MPLAETPIARSTRIAVSRQELFNYEAAPALARSPAFLVRHLFSGERASLRPELQLVAHGLHPRHAARHGKRPLNVATLIGNDLSPGSATSACFTRAASAASSLAITPRAVTDGVAVDLQPLVNANAGSTGALTI
jgi:hypothetical protein